MFDQMLFCDCSEVELVSCCYLLTASIVLHVILASIY